MTTLADIERAVARLPPTEFAAFRDWLAALVASRRGDGAGDLSEPPRLSPGERAELIAQARDRSRLMRDDPADRRLLEELIDIQAGDSRALDP